MIFRITVALLIVGACVGVITSQALTFREKQTQFIVDKYPTLPEKQFEVPHAKKQVVTRIDVKDTQVLYLTGSVDPFSVNVIIEDLRVKEKNGLPLYLIIDSPGGSVLDGARLISAMETAKVPVNTVCVSLCASMGAIIHQHGAQRLMHDRAFLMFHPASGGARGQVENMRSQLNSISKYVNKFNSYIVNRSKVNQQHFNEMVAYEIWIDGEDSKNVGFVDNLVYIVVNKD